MDVTTVKIVLLIVMFIIALAFGLSPIKIYGWLTRRERENDAGRYSLILSLFSCFAGGVFLAVCFLDMLPDAIESVKIIEKEANIELRYPYFELLLCAGFFTVYLIEELFALVLVKKYQRPRSDTGCRRNKIGTGVMDGGPVVENGLPFHVHSKETLIHDRDSTSNLISSLTLVVAMVFHSTLEGFAFGLQKSTIDATSLFLGIIMHKAVVCFSIGMRLVQANPTKWAITTGFVVFVALTAPLGAIVGILIQNSQMNELKKNIVMAVLICISLGTFLYIAFFEILAHERQNEHPNLLQWISAVVGFALIAIFMIWAQ